MRTRLIFSSSDPVPLRPAEAHRAKAAHSHRPVLLHETLEALDIQPTNTVVDATLGGAGHAREIVRLLGHGGLFIGFDLDSDALGKAQGTLEATPLGSQGVASGPMIHLINANFRDLKKELEKRQISHIDKALFDLGWCSDQLEAGRGFSFLKDEPLLMTYGSKLGENALTAATIVNEWSESSLADIIYGWGEERYARRIARAIVEARVHATFTSSLKLAEVITSAVPNKYAHGRIHPATRTFQALRIAVNDELGALDKGLRAAWRMLAPNGRLAVISFHSIEDRAVKRLFLEFASSGEGEKVTKKPIIPTDGEIKENPRARSAKLRVIRKL